MARTASLSRRRECGTADADGRAGELLASLLPLVLRESVPRSVCADASSQSQARMASPDTGESEATRGAWPWSSGGRCNVGLKNRAAGHGWRWQLAKLEAAPVNCHDAGRVHNTPRRDDDNLDLDLKLGLRVQSGTDHETIVEVAIYAIDK
ncbi:unnamed protein product [Urochloa humidicola]